MDAGETSLRWLRRDLECLSHLFGVAKSKTAAPGKLTLLTGFGFTKVLTAAHEGDIDAPPQALSSFFLAAIALLVLSQDLAPSRIRISDAES
jgi:hypothetical protein